MTKSRLFYVVGASGSGKDSLIRYVRQRLTDDRRIIFAHRYITRPMEMDGENHVSLSEGEFAARLEGGVFAMHWDSHGHRYGIGYEIDFWLAKGFHVVVNGSRAYLTEARRRYPELELVWIDVANHVLEERLIARGRESGKQIAARIERASQFSMGADAHVIHNNGALHEAGETLLALISGKMQAAACA
jgi:ribose 1,5-bisphosphokinase